MSETTATIIVAVVTALVTEGKPEA